MQEFLIYLAGKCNGLTKEEQNKWRNDIKTYLETIIDNTRYRIKVINPNDYFNYFEQLHKHNRQIKKFFMSMIDRADLVIVNLNNSDSSVGTGQELQRASDKNIPIVGFGTENIYPWEADEDCQVVFDTMDECVNYVVDYYLI